MEGRNLSNILKPVRHSAAWLQLDTEGRERDLETGRRKDIKGDNEVLTQRDSKANLPTNKCSINKEKRMLQSRF